MDVSLSSWVVTLTAGGMATALFWLVRWVFLHVVDQLRKMEGGLEKMVTELGRFSERLGTYDKQIALLNQSVGRLEQENHDIKYRQDKLAEHWQRQFALREEQPKADS